MKLALGTVQFGVDYGIANQEGRTKLDEARAILRTAFKSGIDTLDTAIAYGDSEQRLGEVGIENWHVISKLPSIPEDCNNITGWVVESVNASLARLKIKKLSGLLLHRPMQLLESNGSELYGAMKAIKTMGLVEKIGVSIYEPKELDLLWPYFDLDIVQIPFNILDRRMLSTGWLKKLHEADVEIHVRSIFLQGLLLMEPAGRPAYFQRWQSLWQLWDRWLDEENLQPAEACIRYALSFPEISKVIVGVDNQEQLEELISKAAGCELTPPAALMSEDPELVNPSQWQT